MALVSKGQYLVPDYVQNYDNTKPTVFAIDLGGGYQQVSDSTAKADLSSDKRVVGMMVSFKESGVWVTDRYEGSDILTVNWINYNNWRRIALSGDELFIVDTLETNVIVLNDSIINYMYSDTIPNTEWVRNYVEDNTFIVGGLDNELLISDGLGGIKTDANLIIDVDTLKFKNANFSENIIADTSKVNESLVRDSTIVQLIDAHAGGGGFEQDVNGNLIAGTNAGSSLTSGTYNMLIGENAGSSLSTGGFNILEGKQAGSNLVTGTYNVIIGSESGTTTGTAIVNNTFVGAKVAASNTGRENTFIGYNVGTLSTSGDYGVFIGYNAGSTNTTSNNNVFIGKESGFSNSEANQTFVGTESGRSNTTGQINTFIGYQSGYSNLTGDLNTYLGYRSGYSATGDGNVFLGYRAGYSESGSNKLYIANSSTTTPLIKGDFTTKTVTINDTLVVTGTIKEVMQVAKAEVLFTNTTQTTIITLPVDAVIWNIGINTTILFDGSGTDLLDIGITGTGNRYIDDYLSQFTGFNQYVDNGISASNIPDEMSGSTNITFQYFDQNSDATQGAAYVYIHYTTY